MTYSLKITTKHAGVVLIKGLSLTDACYLATGYSYDDDELAVNIEIELEKER